MKRLCKRCGVAISEGRRRRQSIFCANQCRQIYSQEKYKKKYPVPELATATTGAMKELLVAVDLLKRGYAVFRSVSPACECDLAILKNKKLIRVEVKSVSHLKKNGGISVPKNFRNPDGFDLLACVDRTLKIHYLPPLPKG